MHVLFFDVQSLHMIERRPEQQPKMSELGYEAFGAAHNLQIEKLLEEGKSPDEVTKQMHAEFRANGGVNWPGAETCINLLVPVFSDDTSVKKHPKFR